MQRGDRERDERDVGVEGEGSLENSEYDILIARGVAHGVRQVVAPQVARFPSQGIRQVANPAIDHLLKEVLNANVEVEYVHAFKVAGVLTVLDFLEMTRADWMSARWDPRPGCVEGSLTTVQVNRLLVLQEMTTSLCKQNERRHPDLIVLGITSDAFHSFRTKRVINRKRQLDETAT